MKKLGIITQNAIRFYEIKRTFKPLVEINHRTYRVDDTLFIRQSDAANALLFYRMDSSQPLGKGQFLDPDMTKVYIDSMKRSKKNQTKLTDFNINKLLPIILIIAVIGSVIYAVG